MSSILNYSITYVPPVSSPSHRSASPYCRIPKKNTTQAEQARQKIIEDRKQVLRGVVKAVMIVNMHGHEFIFWNVVWMHDCDHFLSRNYIVPSKVVAGGIESERNRQ